MSSSAAATAATAIRREGNGIIGFGCDLTYIPRLCNVSLKFGSRFARRVCHASELNSYEDILQQHGSERALQFLAVRWAAKEAAYKAFYPRVIVWHDVALDTSLSEKPVMKLFDMAKKHADDMNITNVHVSVSHDGDYALAQVILE